MKVNYIHPKSGQLIVYDDDSRRGLPRHRIEFLQNKPTPDDLVRLYEKKCCNIYLPENGICDLCGHEYK